MKKELNKIKQDAIKEINKVIDLNALKEIELKYFGRKEGEINKILKNIKNLSSEMKKEVGTLSNMIKNDLQNLITKREKEITKKNIDQQLSQEWIDVTADFGSTVSITDSGTFNPNTMVQYKLEDLFVSMGFSVVDGPDLETDYYNFESLNFEEHHPARDMQDTFFIKGHDKWLMRTHTSNVQARIMQEYGAPIYIVCPGRCYRNEATDARHEHTLYQFEGFIVDEKINYANLKYILEQIAKGLFGEKSKIRFNPKYYPFVEPGFSGDITCFLCEGKGCSVCKNTGWLEFFGAGMIHPNVLKAGNIDPEKYQGIAFGLGLSRLAMLKYNIDDARHICGGDLRFLKQF